MKYALLIFTAALAVLGWLIRDKSPLWVTVVAIALIGLTLIIEIKLERDDQVENHDLRA